VPDWLTNHTHRLLFRVNPIDIGNRASEGMVATFDIDFTQYGIKQCDLSSLVIREYDPTNGSVIDHHANALATVPGELPLRFYDQQIPWDFPDYQGYSDPKTGLALPIKVIPGGGRFFNTIGDGRRGRITWAHAQTGNRPTYYELSFSELPPGAGQRPPPAGFLGDGVNRCLPTGGVSFAPIIHGRVGVSDLSGNGLFDVVLGDGTGHLLWYQNHGALGHPKFDTARFLCSEEGTPIDVGWSAAPEIVDWDGDGLLDLIVGAEKESILFYKNVGDKHHPVFRLMGPLQADGKPLRVPRNYCDEDPQNKIYPVDYEPVPHVVDWTGNGKLDLLAGGYITGRIFYYENIANSPHEMPRLTYRGPLQADGKDLDVTWCAAPCTGDFRNCGKLDLITGAMQQTAGGGDLSDPDKFLWYFENIGTRQRPVLHKVPFPARGRFSYGALGTPRAIDFNNNGLLDLVVSIDGDLLLLPNIGTKTEPLFDAATKSLRVPWGNAPLPWGPSTFVKFDGDDADLFQQDYILVNSGRGSPGVFDRQIPLPGADQINHPATQGDAWFEREFADIDGDGKPDILAADNEGYVWFHRNVGTKTEPKFDPAGHRLCLIDGQPLKVAIPPPDAAAFDKLQGSRAWIAVLDMNHKGLADLAISDTFGKVRLFLHDPTQKPGETPRFEPAIELPTPEPNVRLMVRQIDWNHDGWDDLLYVYANDLYYILLNQPGPNGTRKFSAPIQINVPGCYGDPYVSVVDWNHDGDQDLIIWQYGYTRLVEQSFIEHGYIPGNIVASQSR